MRGRAGRVEQELGDLDRVQRGALAQVVAGEEEDEAVLARRRGRGGCGRRARRPSAPPRAGSGTSTSRTDGAAASSRLGLLGRERLLGLDPDRLARGRPAPARARVVALIGSSGSSRILRVSSRIFDSSSVSSPSQRPVEAEVVLVRRLGPQPLHPLRARARDRLVGRDAHARAGRPRRAAA